MNKKYFLFFSCLAIFCVATGSIIFARNSQSSIAASQVNLDRSFSSTYRAERVINSRKRHREGSDTEQRISSKKYSSKSYQEQQTAVDISLLDLNEANLLSISASQPETQLTATVSLNGQHIKSLTNDDNVLDLSPYLTLGKQVVSISGNYTPANAFVKIEFQGQTTHISQETQGSGKLQQQLIFHVK
ncbi:hypothetical protein [Myxosarcina sp. GI1]|uniref:hypothetical protein n=1 Tax=Myxosarcina sp. GI1 TaxID=1541065 RepID=UPI00068F1F92|nr:hypothetical protein [Myxosarcina sp. GI1]